MKKLTYFFIAVCCGAINCSTENQFQIDLLQCKKGQIWISQKRVVYNGLDSSCTCLDSSNIELIAFHKNQYDEFNFQFGTFYNKDWNWDQTTNQLKGMAPRKFISVD